MHPVDTPVASKGIHISIDHGIDSLGSVFRPCLPHKGGYVVIHRTSAPALEVYKVWFAILEHDIARLEIAIQKDIVIVAQKTRRHLHKLILKPVFVELYAHTFQETVLEVVQIPHNGAFIEISSWITE